MTGFALSLGIAERACAQKGDLSVGLRMTPDGAGLTGKYFLDRNIAFEGQLNAGGVFGLEGQSFTAVGLLEYHVPLPDPSWKVFFGGGLHAGAWDHDGSYVSAEGHVDKGSEAIFGIDGIGGIAYSFKSVPISLTADFKPAINFVTDVDFFPHNMFGFGARYFFGR
jgi:hypothetical protein